MAPLWLQHRGRHHENNVIWPLFSFYSGFQEGLKIGPLYGRSTWGNDRRSSFVLWPFFIHDERGLDTDTPSRSWSVIPSIADTSSQSSFYAVLWPLLPTPRPLTEPR